VTSLEPAPVWCRDTPIGYIIESGTPRRPAMSRTIIRVGGMTCTHCNMAVERALTQIVGVTGVVADFETGSVQVDTDGHLDDAAVREAIAEEGYEVLSIESEPA
jgi:copper chaperone CopZ